MTKRTTKSNAALEKLTAGRTDDDIATVCGVHRSTVSRWRSGAPVPAAAQRLLQLHFCGEFPATFGEFAGFRIVDGRYLVAPGQHWQNAITAEQAREWFYIAQQIDSAQRLQIENAQLRRELHEARQFLASEFEDRLRQMVGALMTLAYPSTNPKGKQP